MCLFLAIIIAATLSSCSKQYYAPGLFQNDVQLMIKPQSQDSVKSKVYISGVLLTQSGASGQGSSTSGLLNLYQSHTLKNVNLSYGVLGYTGNYSRNESSTTNNSSGQTSTTETHISKSFTGYGFNGSASVYFSNALVDFRVLGADLVYTHESGDYLAFRRSVFGQPGILSSPRADMITYGIFTEYVFHPKADLNFGFKVFFNKTTGKVNQDLQNAVNSYENGFYTTGGSLFAEFNRINVHATAAFASNLIAGGIQLGVGYSF